MKKLILVMFTILIAVPAFADTRVQGYHRKDGTYVEPHYRSDSNSSSHDN